MHEYNCPHCNRIIYCNCGSQSIHKNDSIYPYMKSRWCAACREDARDPEREPDDEGDLGGGVGGVSTFGPYRARGSRR
jgi:hypothetical protein